MKTRFLQKAILSIAGTATAILLFLSPGLKLPVLDTVTDTYFREAITKGGVSYATCRVINASVSIIKESSVHLQPAGVGISLAAGQALDPIDDMTERVADVLVTSITSLGVQKLAYEIGVSVAPPVLAFFLFILSVLIWSGNRRIEFVQKTIMRFALLVMVARFCLPISSMVNEVINTRFFDGKIEEVGKKLAAGSAELDKLKDFSLPENGLLGTASFLKRKSAEFNDALAAAGGDMGEIIENLLRLTFLYVGILLIQVVVLPLLAFFFLIKTVNALFEVNIPQVIVHHSRTPQKKSEECS